MVVLYIVGGLLGAILLICLLLALLGGVTWLIVAGASVVYLTDQPTNITVISFGRDLVEVLLIDSFGFEIFKNFFKEVEVIVVVPFINLPVGAAVVACRCQKPNLFIQSMIAIFRNIVLIGSSLFGLSWQNSALIFSTCSLFFTIFGSFWVYRLYIFKKAVVA